MTAMRPETTSEHIARDMREGRFPERSEPQMVADPTGTAPERIWLQDNGDFDAASEVTWCQHRIDDNDTEYVRADLAAVQPAQVLETCGKCMGSGYGGHPDSGQLCADCNGSGGGEQQPDPRDEVIALAITACRIIDDAVKEGYDTVNGLMMHLLEAVEPARTALAAAKAVQHD